MEQVVKLIEYANIAGFPMYPEGDNLIVRNGKNLPFELKKLIQEYKEDILHVYEKGLRV